VWADNSNSKRVAGRMITKTDARRYAAYLHLSNLESLWLNWKDVLRIGGCVVQIGERMGGCYGCISDLSHKQ